MKEIIHILALVVLSFILGALFLRIETMEEEMKREIPNQVHALLDNSIRETIKSKFRYQETIGNVFFNE